MHDPWNTIRLWDWVTVTAPDGTTYRGRVEQTQLDAIPGLVIHPHEGPPQEVATTTQTTYTIRIPDPAAPPEHQEPPVPHHITRAHRHVTRKDPHD